MLSCVEIKTTYELSIDILKNQIGHFEINQFDQLDIKNFLYSNQNIQYSNIDAKKINQKLQIYYNSTDTITKQIQNEINEAFTQSEKEKIAYIYEGVIAIIDAQMKLLFHINKDACLKLSSSVDTKNMYYDVAIIDEAQDTNAFIFKIFLDIKSNIKIICGDNFSSIYSHESINILSSENFAPYPLTTSMRFAKKACDNINKILHKLSKKTKITGKDEDFETNIEVISKKKAVHIYANSPNMLNNIYKSALEQKKIYIVGGFTAEYKEFIAMCYVHSDFNKEFLKITPNIEKESEIFLKFKTIDNYIELTTNQQHKDYYNLLQKWAKGQNSPIERINIVTSNCISNQSQSDISYCLATNTKSREFEYAILANDFIDQTKIHKPNTQETQELKLLYIALSRCTKGACREKLS